MHVVLEEELLRDGLQAEVRLFSLMEKVHLVRLLISAGVKRLQVGSFVDPRRVPQMADTETLATIVRREYPTVACTALVLNRKGLERAFQCGLTHVSMSVSVIDSHSRRNTGLPATRALELMTELIATATAAGLCVRAGVQCAFGDGNEEEIPEAAVITAVEQMTAAGAVEINLADTAGMGRPHQVVSLVALIRRLVPAAALSLHLHGSRRQGLANMAAGLAGGVHLFDTTAGGLGGCPFLQGGGANVATEDAVLLLQQMGYNTSIDVHRVRPVIAYLEDLLGRRLSRG